MSYDEMKKSCALPSSTRRASLPALTSCHNEYIGTDKAYTDYRAYLLEQRALLMGADACHQNCDIESDSESDVNTRGSENQAAAQCRWGSSLAAVRLAALKESEGVQIQRRRRHCGLLVDDLLQRKTIVGNDAKDDSDSDSIDSTSEGAKSGWRPATPPLREEAGDLDDCCKGHTVFLTRSSSSQRRLILEEPTPPRTPPLNPIPTLQRAGSSSSSSSIADAASATSTTSSSDSLSGSCEDCCDSSRVTKAGVTGTRGLNYRPMVTMPVCYMETTKAKRPSPPVLPRSVAPEEEAMEGWDTPRDAKVGSVAPRLGARKSLAPLHPKQRHVKPIQGMPRAFLPAAKPMTSHSCVIKGVVVPCHCPECTKLSKPIACRKF